MALKGTFLLRFFDRRPLRLAWRPALLVAAAFFLRFNTLHYGLVYDDPYFLFQQEAVAEDAGLPTWFGTSVHGLYRPVRSLLYALLTRLVGANPGVYHLIALLLDMMVALLLYAVLKRFFPATAALAGTLLWLVHPTHSERVVLISASFDIWGLVFMMAALLVALNCRSDKGNPGVLSWVGLTLLSALAVFANEESLLLPAYLALLAAGSGGISVLFRHRRTLLALSLTTGVCVLYLFVRVVVIGLGGRLDTPPTGSEGRILPVMLAVMEYFFRTTFIPTQLHETYPPFAYDSLAHLPVLAGGVVLSLLLLTTAHGLWKGHWVGVASGWWLVAIAPFSNLIPNVDQRHVRYLYMPTMALAILGAQVYKRFCGESQLRAGLKVALFVAFLLTYASMTLKQNRVYRDSIALWGDSYNYCPRCSRAAINYGIALGKWGRFDQAREVLLPMLIPKPGYEMAFVALAAVELDAGNPGAAKELLSAVMEWAPEHGQAKKILESLQRINEE